MTTIGAPPTRLSRSLAFTALMAAGLSSGAVAQRSGISSPGSAAGGGLGQTTRFDNDFNPALSLTVDMLIDWVEYDGASQSGLDTKLRRADILIADWVDPSAFAWATVAYEEEELVLDEAAIEYVGLEGNHTLRGGRFFLDFGKQMQAHIEELRTTERPLVLREFLGEELAGDGLQWDNWFSSGDVTLVRYSLGLFSNVAGGDHGHGAEGATTEAEIHVADRKDATDMGFVARLTAMTEVGTNGTLQFGTSARFLPDFAFEHEGSALETTGQNNAVYGLDLTYGWVADNGIQSWTTGGEFLLFDGDLAAELDDNGTPGNIADDSLNVLDDTVSGLYWYADHAWSQFDSAGVQYSIMEEPNFGTARQSEFDLYYTHQLSEFLRLRVTATRAETQHGEDSTRLAIQITGFIGPHGHGLNW